MVMTVILWVLVFIISIGVLLKASDYFTDAASKIGIKFGMPTFIVGVTIVTIGTTLPELISSLFAVTVGASEIVIGTVIGSNIANILLILGVVAIFARKIKTEYELLKTDLPIFFASALYVSLVAYDGVINGWEGIIGILGIITYLTFAGTYAKKVKGVYRKEVEDEKVELKKEGLGLQFLILIISAAFIFIGAKYTVDSVIQISGLLNIAKEIIAISAVAIGTSLPELAVGIQAIKKGNASMAFGNVLGSNIFNSFAILGASSLVGDLVIPATIISFSIPVLIGVSLLYFFTIQDKQLTIWEGLIFILAYVLYLGKIFALF